MKTLILNGSPKKNIKESNTNIFINEFMRNMKTKCTVKFISKEDPIELANTLNQYDNILFFTPLYIHSVPGSVMKFIEKLTPENMQNKNLSFLIQAGFTESSQENYVKNYFEQLSKDLKCNYLGTVVKGEAAGAYMIPGAFKKVFKLFNELGEIFEETNCFDKEIVKKLGYPYKISDLSLFTRTMLKITEKTGLSTLFWNRTLHQNKAYKNRMDKPFL